MAIGGCSIIARNDLYFNTRVVKIFQHLLNILFWRVVKGYNAFKIVNVKSCCLG